MWAPDSRSQRGALELTAEGFESSFGLPRLSSVLKPTDYTGIGYRAYRLYKASVVERMNFSTPEQLYRERWAARPGAIAQPPAFPGVGAAVAALVERFDIEPYSDFSAK